MACATAVTQGEVELQCHHPCSYGEASVDVDSCGKDLVHVDEAINSLGFGRFQKKLLLLCGLGIAGDAMEKAAMMYILQAAKQQWNVEGTALGLLGSASGLGQVLGASVFGWLSDVYGRRTGLLCALGLTMLLGLTSAAVNSYYTFLALRFTINIGLAGAMPCTYTLFQEFVPVQERSKWVPVLYSSYGIGRIVTAIAAWMLLELSWRAYMVAIALPSGVLLFFFRHVPETPQYLLAQGRSQEAWDTINDVAATNGVVSPLSKESRLAMEKADFCVNSSWEALATPTAKLLCAMWFLVACGTEWFNWTVPMLEESGVSESVIYGSLIFFNTNELVVPLLISLLPRPMLDDSSNLFALSCGSAAVTLVFFGVSMWLHLTSWLLVISSVFAAYCGVSVWVIIYTVTPSYFPARLRGTGFGACQGFNRCEYFVGPLIGSNLVDGHKLTLLASCTSCYLLLALLSRCLQPLSATVCQEDT